jgi:hypothetical protein
MTDTTERYGAELDAAAELLQAVHPVGKYKALGRMEVVAALRDVLGQRADLLSACKSWLAYMERLDADTEFGDPLREARRLYHGKRIEQTIAAVRKAEGTPE